MVVKNPLTNFSVRIYKQLGSGGKSQCQPKITKLENETFKTFTVKETHVLLDVLAPCIIVNVNSNRVFHST